MTASRRLIEIRDKDGLAAAARAFSEADPARDLEMAEMQIREMSYEEHALLARRAQRLNASERALWLASAASALLGFRLLITSHLQPHRHSTPPPSPQHHPIP